MMSSEPFPYRAKEHYEFPTTPAQQIQEELRLYPNRLETIRMMIGLREMYKNLPFMNSIRQYAQFAVQRDEAGNVATKSGMNDDFYAGALLAVHANAAVMPTLQRRGVLNHDFLEHVATNPAKSDIETGITAWLDDWLGIEENNWAEYMIEQDEAYQRAAAAVAGRLYKSIDDAQLNFMGGVAFGTCMIEQTQVKEGPPA